MADNIAGIEIACAAGFGIVNLFSTSCTISSSWQSSIMMLQVGISVLFAVATFLHFCMGRSGNNRISTEFWRNSIYSV